MQLYKDIFKRSWTITKKHPTLWLLGFMTLFWGGKGIDLELYFTNAGLLRSRLSPFRPEFWFSGQWEFLADSISSNQAVLGIFMTVVLLLGFVAFLVIMLTQIGLIDAYGTYGKKASATDAYTFAHALEASTDSIGRVALLNIGSKVLSYAFLALAAIPLFVGSANGEHIAYSLLLFLVATPFTIVISIITKFAANGIVLKDESIGVAVTAAVKMFKQNIGTTIEYSAFVYGVYILLTAGTIAGTFIITLPFLFITILLYNGFDSTAGLGAYQVSLWATGLLLIVGGFAIFGAWQNGGWTLLYQELTRGRRRSKIHRIMKGE